MPPLPITFDEETTDLIGSTTRLQKDLAECQIPRLRACAGPLTLQQTYAAEVREDIETLTRKVETLNLLVWDQKGEKNKRELKGVVDSLKEGLVKLRQESRVALLASKKNIDSQSRSRREELLRSAAVTERKSNEKVTDDALMKTNNDVTDAFRRTINLMQGELERSVLSTQLLDASSASLKSTSSAHDRLTDLMSTSKQLVTVLEKTDWLDRMLIVSAFAFFLLVVLFIVKQRILDRGLKIAFWWTRFLPDFSVNKEVLRSDEYSQLVTDTVAVSTVLSSSVAASITLLATSSSISVQETSSPVVGMDTSIPVAASPLTYISIASDSMTSTLPEQVHVEL